MFQNIYYMQFADFMEGMYHLCKYLNVYET
jgi:hypothetical protein